MATPQPTEQENIDAGARIRIFVEDPIVQQAVASLASDNYNKFKTAKTDDEIRMAHTKGIVLDEFLNELQVIIDKGTVASINRKERELREERSKPRSRVKQAGE